MPVFIDTLEDIDTTKRFGEHYGSYPVIRVHDHSEHDLAGRLDGNPVQGKIPVAQLLEHMARGAEKFRAPR